MRTIPFIVIGALCALASSAQARQLVSWNEGLYPSGTIVISQGKRELFLVLDGSTAIAYPVAVAKPGKEWLGPARVEANLNGWRSGAIKHVSRNTPAASANTEVFIVRAFRVRIGFI